MEFIKIKTRVFLPPKDDIYDLFDEYLPKLEEGDILLVTSKVLAIHQGRCAAISRTDKEKLISQEAEYYLRDKKRIFTIKNNTVVSSAGLDESNGNGYYILRPKKIRQAARELRVYLKKKFKLKKLGLIITDSVSAPLRLGAVGLSIGFCGLKPLKDYRGAKDIFGRRFRCERVNLVDPLAAIGVALIGEGNERTPFLIIRGSKFIEFTDKDTWNNLFISRKQDIFSKVLQAFKHNK